MRCLVPSCNRDLHHTVPNVSKHRFPVCEERRLEWLKAVATVDKRVLAAKINFKVARICSDHFTPDCFTTRAMKEGKARVILDREAVPSVFVPRPDADYDSGSDQGETMVKQEPGLTDEQLQQLKEKTATGVKAKPSGGPKPRRIAKTIRYAGDFTAGKSWSYQQLATAFPKLQAKLIEKDKKVKQLRAQNTRLHDRIKSMQLYDAMRTTGGAVPPMKEEQEEERPPPVLDETLDNSDGFYDFLKPDSSTEKAKKNTKDSPAVKLSCSCDCCRKAHALKVIKERSKSTRSMQTDDMGPRPAATDIPFANAAELLCCRLCFSVDYLEPLSYGTIVVRDEMLDKIYVSTGILIAPKPRKRFFICKPCEKLINDFYIYRQLVYSNSRDLAVVTRKTKPGKGPQSIQLPPPRPTDIRPVQAVLVEPKVSYRKVCPKIPLPKQALSDDNDDDVVEIKSEPDDPLAEGEESMTVPLPTTKSALPTETVAVPVIPMETEELEAQEDLDEEETWCCWNCAEPFRFQFECAKHLLLSHQEDVDTIKRRMNLDELNANMLEMMSLKK